MSSMTFQEVAEWVGKAIDGAGITADEVPTVEALSTTMISEAGASARSLRKVDNSSARRLWEAMTIVTRCRITRGQPAVHA